MAYSSYSPSSRPPLGNHHLASVSTPSPLRHSSNAMPTLYPYANGSPSTSPTRTGTVSYATNGSYDTRPGHRRGLSEFSASNEYISRKDLGQPLSPENFRAALRPLQQAPSNTPTLSHSRSQSFDPKMQENGTSSPYSPASPPMKSRPHSLAISRSDSIRAPVHDRSRPSGPQVHFATQPTVIDKPNLEGLEKSSTGYLRTLSKYTQNGSEEDFAIKSPEQEVAGLHGRRRLQRTMTKRDKKDGGMSKFASGWQATKWIDQQRQFLQAYEYLCHIGEAKEWIEDIIQKEIPPIVQLEEALRDGVTLAEIVQALCPDKPFRIFRHPKLQFRHSDNIAAFFRYLADVELPELFRFELVDLYEKKNIPKVIYCIHALSWLLFRKGIVDFRIGNLVGQLQFEDHELETMQKGLDKAGISMPNFSGMSADFGVPEPEPVESEEDRIDRELAENESSIVDLQSQIRGAMIRNKLGDTMQDLWDFEVKLVELQSMIRGDFSRQIVEYRFNMRRFAVQLQSAVRGYLVRSRRKTRERHWKDKEKQVITLQSLVRARQAREDVRYIKSRMQRHDSGVRNLQAAIRGALARWNVGDQFYATREAEEPVIYLQAAIRGALSRQRADEQYTQTREASTQIVGLQAAMRGLLVRRNVESKLAVLQHQSRAVTQLQASLRGMIARQRQARLRKALKAKSPLWIRLQSLARSQAQRAAVKNTRQALHAQIPVFRTLQAVARASDVRRNVMETKAELSQHEPVVQVLQSFARAHVYRRKHEGDLLALDKQAPAITELQALARACIQRQQTFDLLCEMNKHDDQTVALQSMARAMLIRGNIGSLLAELEAEEDGIVALQALVRGGLVRRSFVEKKRFYRQNMEKVIKIQSFVRGKQQGEAYKSLTTGKNPPVGTVKNFVHLLNDSDFDFDEELEFERLRKTVVQHVRQNEMAEQYIDQLDIKIALLVKNKITLDEVVKHQKHFGGHVGSLLNNKDLASKDPFDLRALNKNSRKKLEHYQELFFVLQTQPQYLARLFKKLKEQGMPEKEGKRMEMLMMGLFGFAQKRREEYYLLKLIARSISEEADSSPSLQDYLRGSFFWMKLFNAYIRSPRDRKYMRDLFGPLVRESIFENPELDLESDPMQIYRSSINNEELRTGQRSRRNPDIPREEAIRDPETRETFIAHLQDLRDIADQFFVLLEETMHRMPFGVRYIGQQTFHILCARFPHEEQAHLLQVVGNWIWKNYLVPALTQPEMWGVIDRGLSPLHRKNLSEVGKVLGQVATGRLFGGENVYLQPLNTWVSEAIERLNEIWSILINVRDAERQFDIDEFNDLFARTKPTLYIKMADIFAIHQLVASDLPYICPTQDDVLPEIIRELGSAKNNENEMMGVSTTEISLQLSPKFHDVQDPDAEIKSLFMETKRLVLYIIRVQSGANLLDILVRPITVEDEDKWLALLDEEIMHEQHQHNKTRPAYAASIAENPASTLLDITSMTYAELKSAALENILLLEQHGRLTRQNQYQDLLNAIALDIRTKHRRRLQRAREMEGVRATLAQLDAKASFLDEQLASYNDYIEQAMITLQNKKGKKRFLLPFTKQYNHERELARSGRTPKFGSFKYSARSLAEKGVLVAWAGYNEQQWGRINITISSDEVGVFHIEGSMGSLMIPGASASVPLDDLLQAQFDNHQFMTLFKSGGDGEGLKLNVNLFLHLVFKKFYREE